MSIEMQNGRNLRISMLLQHGTYTGLLAGHPTKDMNDAIIENALKDANRRLFASDNQNIKVTMVTPKIEECESKYGTNRIVSYPVLPGVITTVLIENFDEHAVVVMFNDEIANQSEIQNKLRDLDWKQISESYTF